ncbi:jg8411 [Pararge aegeria aegeria]|uniref:Jg8411 protein n=1 Tax=Pararge aegeria aegeria TaxID=348720 RepID=A0A8S4SH01_9NEOP|nr:jg8411 [Pararge aegeria aegeria]
MISCSSFENLLSEAQEYISCPQGKERIISSCTTNIPTRSSVCVLQGRSFGTAQTGTPVARLCFLPSNRKKNPLLMYNNYTYKKQWECTTGKVIWYCSKRKRGCKAFVHSMYGVFTPGDLNHTHPAPAYTRGHDGSWVKL